MSIRRTHSPEFKSRVAMEAISGRKTIQKISADCAVGLIELSQWKEHLPEGANELSPNGIGPTPLRKWARGVSPLRNDASPQG